jgi:chromosome segregation ATPase
MKDKTQEDETRDQGLKRWKQEIFDLMAQEHELTLTDSEMHDIIEVCAKYSRAPERSAEVDVQSELTDRAWANGELLAECKIAKAKIVRLENELSDMTENRNGMKSLYEGSQRTCNNWSAHCDGIEQQRDDALAEVARLRKSLESTLDDHALILAENVNLEAEVEKLKESKEDWILRSGENFKEVERLQEYKHKLLCLVPCLVPIPGQDIKKYHDIAKELDVWRKKSNKYKHLLGMAEELLQTVVNRGILSAKTIASIEKLLRMMP